MYVLESESVPPDRRLITPGWVVLFHRGNKSTGCLSWSACVIGPPPRWGYVMYSPTTKGRERGPGRKI